jgi:hypothetical protein
MIRPHAYVGIRPAGSFAETASILGEILGGLTFVPDARVADGFPVLVADDGYGNEYRLIGVPRAELDEREHKHQDFELHFGVGLSALVGTPVSQSDVLAAKILASGRLQAWSLE